MISEEEQTSINNYKGGFWVSRKAIDALVSNRATAEQICAYLVLARFNTPVSDLSFQYSRTKSQNTYFPIFSTAGKLSLKTYLGFSPSRAERVLRSLLEMRTGTDGKLIFSKVEWAKITKSFRDYSHLLDLDENQMNEYVDTPLMIAKSKDFPIRYALNTFGEKRSNAVWFPNEIVTGITEKSRQQALKLPLKTICRLPEISHATARLLILFYANYDKEFCGADPMSTFRLEFETCKVDDVGSISLYRTKSHRFYSNGDFASMVSGGEPDNDLIKNIIEHPLVAGLFYCLVLVVDEDSMDSPPSMAFDSGYLCRRVMYELDTKKDKILYRPIVDCLSAKEIERAIRQQGFSVADQYSAGHIRFNGKYPVLAFDHEHVLVLGVFCPRFVAAQADVWMDEIRQLREHRYQEALSRIENLRGLKHTSININNNEETEC